MDRQKKSTMNRQTDRQTEGQTVRRQRVRVTEEIDEFENDSQTDLKTNSK